MGSCFLSTVHVSKWTTSSPSFSAKSLTRLKKVSGKEIDVSASRGTLEVRQTETAVCNIFKFTRRSAPKGGTA